QISSGPKDHDELSSFVAHYGSAVAQLPRRSQLEAVAIRAVGASRRDSALARMVPVFLWRAREAFDLTKLVAGARAQGVAAELGFFLEVAAKLGRSRAFEEALAALRPFARPDHPSYFFHGTTRRPFERMAADLATPEA